MDVGAKDLPGAGLEAVHAEMGVAGEFEGVAGAGHQAFLAEVIKGQHNASARPTEYRQLVDGHRFGHIYDLTRYILQGCTGNVAGFLGYSARLWPVRGYLGS